MSTAVRALLLVAMAYVGVAQAATPVSGPITANTTWALAQSPFEVTADVSVANGATLNIEAGAVVYFDAGANLIVSNGALNARGTAGQPITFTSVLDTATGAPAPGNWGQIRFLSGTSNAAIMEYAQVRYGQGISVQSASPTFNYLQISQNLGAAITVDLNASPAGVGNQATGNTLNGISVPAGDLTGTVTWGIKGIPYVVSSGVVSVGTSPVVSSITPSNLQQSLAVDATISGSRLTGADAILFDSAGIIGTVSAGGNDTSVPVHITVSAAQPLGSVPFSLRTAAGWARYAAGVSVIPLKPTISVTNITPTSMRRGETKTFQISGSSLLGAQVTPPAGAGLSLASLTTTDTLASFSLTASTTAVLGSQTLSVSNPAVANGAGAMLVTINDLVPRVDTGTLPMAVPPDGLAHTFNLTLTNADVVDNTFNLSVLDPTILTVSPATVTIPAGAKSAPITITGLTLGYTTLTITSPTLATATAQIYSTNLLNGATVGPVASVPVGVNVPYSVANLPVGTSVPVISTAVGVNVPFTLSSILPVGTVVPVISTAVGVSVPFTAATILPVGTVVPVISMAVGVSVPFTLSSILPVGTVVPVISATVGVTVP